MINTLMVFIAVQLEIAAQNGDGSSETRMRLVARAMDAGSRHKKLEDLKEAILASIAE